MIQKPERRHSDRNDPRSTSSKVAPFKAALRPRAADLTFLEYGRFARFKAEPEAVVKP